MLEILVGYDGSPQARRRICQIFDQHLLQLTDTSQFNDRLQVGRLELAVARDPSECFRFDQHGHAQLHAEGCDFAAGRFVCRSLRDLRQESRGTGRLRLWVLEGQSAITDIGALQATANPHSLFQVASQFNCLESPGPRLAEVRDYFFDPTQGPRASISAYPGTLLRHYAAPAPEGGRFRQNQQRQLNLLHKVTLEGVARVESGYLQAQNVRDPGTFATLLEDHFEDVEVGVHEGLQVVLGANWDGVVTGHRRIAQVFTSTLAAGGYGRVDFTEPTWLRICRQLQRAAYLGTLTAAASLGQELAVLTLIGGGVFGNPIPLIWDSILWACREVAPCLPKDLTVVVNGRNLSHSIELHELQEAAHKRGGELILCTQKGARIEGP